MNENYLLNDVAKRLGVKHYRIAYALTTGLVAEPETRIAGKRIFHDEDVERLAAHFGIEPGRDGKGPASAGRRRRRGTGKTGVPACID